MTGIIMRHETYRAATISAWALTVFLGIAGINTWWSSHHSLGGLLTAILLFAGFLGAMKTMSPLLFDPTQSDRLRYLAGGFLLCLVLVDVFSGSHHLQTGTMDRVTAEQTGTARFQTAKANADAIRAQLAACPSGWVKNCAKPLTDKLADANKAMEAAYQTGGGEAAFWRGLADLVSIFGVVPLESVVLWTFVLIMILASSLVVVLFGLIGNAVVIETAAPQSVTNPVHSPIKSAPNPVSKPVSAPIAPHVSAVPHLRVVGRAQSAPVSQAVAQAVPKQPPVSVQPETTIEEQLYQAFVAALCARAIDFTVRSRTNWLSGQLTAQGLQWPVREMKEVIEKWLDRAYAENPQGIIRPKPNRGPTDPRYEWDD